MSATTSSKDGPMKNRSSEQPEPRRPLRKRLTLLFLALACLFPSSGTAQGPPTGPASLGDFAGLYKEQSSEKRLRVIEKGGRLLCESADGLSLTLFHLVQLAPADTFQIAEASGREQIRFKRNGAGNVTGLSFGAATYLRLPPAGGAAPAPGGPSEPLRSPAPFPGATPPRLPRELNNRTGD